MLVGFAVCCKVCAGSERLTIIRSPCPLFPVESSQEVNGTCPNVFSHALCQLVHNVTYPTNVGTADVELRSRPLYSGSVLENLFGFGNTLAASWYWCFSVLIFGFCCCCFVRLICCSSSVWLLCFLCFVELFVCLFVFVCVFCFLIRSRNLMYKLASAPLKSCLYN